MKGLQELSCRRRVAVLLDYLDRELPAAQRKLVSAHRRTCGSCGAFLASLERTVSLLRALGRGAKPPQSAHRALLAALARGSSGAPSKTAKRR